MTYSSHSRLGWLTGILVGLGLIAVGVPSRLVTNWTYAVEKGRIQANSEQLAGPRETANTFRMVAQVARPGVVQIHVSGGKREQTALAANERSRQELRNKIEELWRDRDTNVEEFLKLTQRMRELDDAHDEIVEHIGRGTASGIIYDADGYVLTNNHVVDGRGSIRVRLCDNREYDASVIGTDAKTDLAVIKIDAPDLNPLSFGDSDQMEVGDWVLAVGAPFGLSQSVTHGIISAKGRNEINTGRRDIVYQDFMQTDAAINPGNSGGPLLNLRGEVVGVNTAIATDGSGANAGVAFTIPSNMARRIAEQLKSSGEVARGWLGLTLQNLHESDVALLGLNNDRGAMVDLVYEGSAADKAGLRPEDVIVNVNERRVDDIPGVRNAIADVSPGASCKLTIIRDGKQHELSAVVDRQPADPNQYAAQARPIFTRAMRELPFEVRSLREGLAQSIRDQREDRGLLRNARTYLDANRKGVFVMHARGESKSGAYNIEPGDLVVSADDTPVASVADLTRALEASRKRSVIQLQILNLDGEQRTVEVRLK